MTLKEWLLTSLGYPTVNVELTDEQLNVAIHFALQNYLSYADLSSFEKIKIQNFYSGNNIVPINNDPPLPGEIIVDPDFLSYVIFGSSSQIFIDFEDWEKRLLMKTIFGNGGSISSNYSLYLNTLGWFDDMTYLFGQTPTWRIYDRNNILLSPTPQRDGKLGIVFYNVQDFTEFEDNIIFKELALGKAMVILGEVYSKYGTLPSANGEISLKDLITRGEQKITEAINNLKSIQMFPGIFVE